jgi:peptidoglycan/LPS O-acetylase OafA/YrhL
MFKISSLDGLRAVAVLLVVFSHAGYGDIVPGGLGVTIFFFLSGFLITTLLVKEYSSSGTISIKDFYLRRFFRLIPSLLLTLVVAHSLVAVGLLGGGSTVKGALAQIFYMSNYLDAFGITVRDIPAGTVVLWSLAVEEHFYLFYPLLFLILNRAMGRKKMSGVLIGLTAIILAWRLVEYCVMGVSPDRIEFRTDSRFDSILWGCIYGLLSTNVAAKVKSRPSGKELALLCLGCAGLLFSLVYRDDLFRHTFRYTLQGICLIPVFRCAVAYADVMPFKWLNGRALEWMGKNSYAVYLIHFVVIEAIRASVPTLKSSILTVVIALVLSSLYAYVIEVTIEPTFKRLRAKHRSKAVAA